MICDLAGYELSTARLEPAWQARGLPDETSRATTLIASYGSDARQAVIDAVNSFDAPAYLQRPGLSDSCMRAVQVRLLEGSQAG